MSVIAKLVIRGRDHFSVGSLVTLGCLCDNDLMAEYADDHEDKLFTRYSPWGEMKLNLKHGYVLGEDGEAFYVMITSQDESEDTSFPGAVAYGPLRVVSVTDFGDNMARRVEMCDDGWEKDTPRKAIEHFNWKMAVDNPPVFNQLKPSSTKGDYWIAFYPASRFDRNGAISAAHS